MIHREIMTDVRNLQTGEYNFDSILSLVKEEIKDFDIKYYHQETVFCDEEEYSSFPKFNTPSSFGDAMIRAGFNLVSLASNHSYDLRKMGADSSIQYWRSHPEVLSAGMYQDETERKQWRIATVNQIKYGFLSYTLRTNAMFTERHWPTVALYDAEKVKMDIETLRPMVDVLIVAIHWGHEYTFEPVGEQKKIAKYLSDLGVDLILGTHSHTIQPVQKIGKTLVFYSLGNLISNQKFLKKSEKYWFGDVSKGAIGMLSSLKIRKIDCGKYREPEITLDDVTIDLTYTYSRGYHDYLVVPFSKMEKRYLTKYMKIYEQYAPLVTVFDPNHQWLTVKKPAPLPTREKK